MDDLDGDDVTALQDVDVGTDGRGREKSHTERKKIIAHAPAQDMSGLACVRSAPGS